MRGVGAVALTGTVVGCTGDGGATGGATDTETTATSSTAEDDPSTGEDAIPVVTGAGQPFEPFTIGTEPAEVTGFDIEMLEHVIEEAPGYTHEKWGVVVDGWPDVFYEAIHEGDADIMTGAVTIKAEREQRWDIEFTDPYYVVNQAVLVEADGTFQPNSPEDFSGHVIGARKETTGAEVVQGAIEDGILSESNFEQFDNNEELITAIENDTIEAGVIDGPVGHSYAEKKPVTVAFEVETGEAYGFVVEAGRDDLLAALNEGIEAVTNNETLYNGLTSKWLR
jgi:polar amino acid transport system substrate-binding protein